MKCPACHVELRQIDCPGCGNLSGLFECAQEIPCVPKVWNADGSVYWDQDGAGMVDELSIGECSATCHLAVRNDIIRSNGESMERLKALQAGRFYRLKRAVKRVFHRLRRRLR
jgi:hypothetical protein